MKKEDLKNKKIIVGDPIGRANSMAEFAERMFDNISRLEFLKEEFENNNGMAGTFRLDRLPYYIFLFNYQNNNQ